MEEELLKDYSDEQIRELALDHINQNNEELAIYKVESVDKEYKKHNKELVKKTIRNASIVAMFASIMLFTDSSISRFGSQDIDNIFESVSSVMSNLPGAEMALAMYAKMLDGLKEIIDNVGVFGILLATKSLHLIISTTKDTIKSFKIKKELNCLQEELSKIQGQRKNSLK